MATEEKTLYDYWLEFQRAKEAYDKEFVKDRELPDGNT